LCTTRTRRLARPVKAAATASEMQMTRLAADAEEPLRPGDEVGGAKVDARPEVAPR
jgi:hypothetical protein